MYILKVAQTNAEIKQALNLVKKYYSKYYKSYPVELPDYYVVAVDAKTKNVVASISLMIKKPFSETKLEIEEYFEFSLNEISSDIIKKPVVGLGRWVSTYSELTAFTILAVLKLASALGAEYLTSFHNDIITSMLISKYKLPIKPFKRNVREFLKHGPYKNYFSGEIFLVVEKIDKIINYIENNYKIPENIKIEIPENIDLFEKIKLTESGIK